MHRQEEEEDIKVSEPDDKRELEADMIADKVTRMSDVDAVRKKEKKTEEIQEKSLLRQEVPSTHIAQQS